MTWWDAVKNWYAGKREEPFPTPSPETPDREVKYTGAADWLSKRANLTTVMGSKELAAEWTEKARAQAFFSARVAEGHILDRLRKVSDAFSRGEIGQAEARTELKKFLLREGYDPKQAGLRNLASTARLNLILEQNARMAAAVGQYQAGMDPDMLEAFPYWRYISRNDEMVRDDHARYNGKVYSKLDPIWRRIFPPRDFRCRCRIEQLEEEEARSVGISVGGKLPPLPESGFAFDPAHAFEEFELSAINDNTLRKKTADGLKHILSENKTSGLLRNREKRKTQWQTAYQSRIERWEKETRKTGLKSEAVEILLKCYTPEAAKYGKPPKIVANPRGKTYLTKDGKILYIGSDAKTPEDVAKKIGNLSHKLKRGKQYQLAKANRLKREAKLLNANIISGFHSMEQDLMMTNPNNKQGIEYQINCQRCVTTYEARRRGIDVEALPNYGDRFGVMMRADGTLDPDGWTSAYKNPKPVYCGAKNGVETGQKVVQQMEMWGEGARAIVRVQWQGGNTGHVFIAENVNGEVRFIDPQTDDTDVEKYFNCVKKNKTYAIRIDNLKFADNVKKCCKKR